MPEEAGGRTQSVEQAMDAIKQLEHDGRMRYQKDFGSRWTMALHNLRCLRDMAEHADSPVERGVRVDD